MFEDIAGAIVAAAPTSCRVNVSQLPIRPTIDSNPM